MDLVNYLPYSEFNRILEANLSPANERRLLASMASLNRLAYAQQAGMKLSDCCDASMELLVWMYEKVRSTESYSLPKTSVIADLDSRNPAIRSLRFSSKLSQDLFADSIDGKADESWLTTAPGSAIPHGIGLAMGRTLNRNKGRTIVLTDNTNRWQSQLCNPLVTMMQQELKALCVVVRLDKDEETDWDSLQHQVISFGWRIHFCDSIDALDKTYETVSETDSPTVIICQFDTQPVMENERLTPGIGVSDFPSPPSFRDRFDCYADSLDIELSRLDLPSPKFASIELNETDSGGTILEDLDETLGDVLLQLTAEHRDIVLLDAMHTSPHYCTRFKQLYKDRYLKDSSFRDTAQAAAGLSGEGMLPIICSTSALQFNLEHLLDTSRVIFIAHDSGLSAGIHNSGTMNLTDIAQFNSRTNCEIIHPACADEAYSAMQYAVEELRGSALIRISSGKTANSISLPQDYYFKPGVGAVMRDGRDALLFAYGPILLQRALETAELLSAHDYNVTIVNMPWLNRVDLRWLRPLISSFDRIHVLDDHVSAGGLGDYLLRVCTEHQLLQNRRFSLFGTDGSDTMLTGEALLRHHSLDTESLAAEILKSAGENNLSRRAQEAADKLRKRIKDRDSEESTSAMLEMNLNMLKSL